MAQVALTDTVRPEALGSHGVVCSVFDIATPKRSGGPTVSMRGLERCHVERVVHETPYLKVAVRTVRDDPTTVTARTEQQYRERVERFFVALFAQAPSQRMLYMVHRQVGLRCDASCP